MPIGAALAVLSSVKGASRINDVSFSAAAGFAVPPPCSYDSGADNGKYATAIAQLTGAKEEICTPNWQSTTQNLATAAFRGRTTLFLLAPVDSQATASIAVSRNGAALPSTAWTFDAASNAILLTGGDRVAPGETVAVTYPGMCLP